MNVLTPTLVGIILSIKDLPSDILCCWILTFRHLQHAFQRRVAVRCDLLGGLPQVRINLGLEPGYLIQR